jgi:type II secretory pathway component HofQ
MSRTNNTPVDDGFVRINERTISAAEGLKAEVDTLVSQLKNTRVRQPLNGAQEARLAVLDRIGPGLLVEVKRKLNELQRAVRGLKHN